MGEFICFLIGPNGSGKTTVGRMLADFLSITFIDLDKEIENLSGTNLAALFKENDFEKIAQIEYKIFDDLASKKNFILAVSVNSINNIQNNPLININKKDKLHINLNTSIHDNLKFKDLSNNKVKTKVVYLAASPTNQYVRSMLSSKPSPMLLMLDNKLQYLIELAKKMEPIYNSMADFVVNTDNCLVEEVVNKIIDYLYCSAYS